MAAHKSGFALLCLLSAGHAWGQPDVSQLSIGDPTRQHDMAVERDAIVDARRGDVISRRTLGERLADRRIVLIGEQHTDAAYHAVQLRVLESLRAAGQPLLLALEMFPADRQQILDAWTRGELDEPEFLTMVDWYRIWGYDWRYYRGILRFARNHAIPIVGLNTIAGAEGEPQAGADLDSEDYRTLLRSFFESDSPVHGGLSADQLEALFTAQSRRDASMARNLEDGLRRYPGRTAVVLAGIGHVLYELGIVRQLSAEDRASAATIIPVPVPGDAGNRIVSASVGDFAWGMPEAAFPVYPELGVLTTTTPTGLRVIFVEPGSAAAAADIRTADVLDRYERWPLRDRSDLGRALESAQWGDTIELTIERDGEQIRRALSLRRGIGE